MKRRTLLGTIGGSLLSVPVLAAYCPPQCDVRTDNIVVLWNRIAASRVKFHPEIGPVGDAIMGAGLHSAIYAAWAKQKGKRVSDKETAISYAAYRFLCDRFPDPDSVKAFTDLLISLGYDPNNHSEIGNDEGKSAIFLRSTDASNYNGRLKTPAYSDPTDFVPTNDVLEFSNPRTDSHNDKFVVPADVFKWQPLKNAAGIGQKFANGQMGNVNLFSLKNSDHPTYERLLQKPDYLKDMKLFRTECERSIDYSSRLTDKEKLQVEFWADGPGTSFYPPSHWRFMAESLVQPHELDKAVKLFYTLSVALADAGIITWRAKRAVNGSRPITGIRTLFKDEKIRAWGGPGRPTEMIYGDSFSPYNPSDINLSMAHQSPGFPGWPSGHTMFSSSAQRVLELFTGGETFNYSIIVPANIGLAEPNVPPVPTEMKFATFADAALSSTMSRIWSGIHFWPDCSPDVMKVGKMIGAQVWKNSRSLFA